MCTPVVPQVTRRHPWTVQDLESYALFDKHFVKKSLLGRGGDGEVYSYVHNFGYDKVAVKTPYRTTSKGNKALAQEIENLKAVGKHDHIVGMLASCPDFRPLGPAIMFPVCDLGDLLEYRDKRFKQQTAHGLSPHILEATILKLIRDISLGLNFLHNQSTKCYVHQDLKPDNILVVTPPDFIGTVPSEPVFRITDLARLVTYSPAEPIPEDHPPKDEFRGTFAYAPPRCERITPLKPAIDIWGLAATIQQFALNIPPTQSRTAFIRDRRLAGLQVPAAEDFEAWNSDHWRSRRPVIYRPLNILGAELRESWDVDEMYRFLEFHRPYSAMLNNCMRRCLMRGLRRGSRRGIWLGLLCRLLSGSCWLRGSWWRRRSVLMRRWT
jgi:serine/threonine protein kinase